MNPRLETAAMILAGYRANPDDEWALADADALIKAVDEESVEPANPVIVCEEHTPPEELSAKPWGEQRRRDGKRVFVYSIKRCPKCAKKK